MKSLLQKGKLNTKPLINHILSLHSRKKFETKKKQKMQTFKIKFDIQCPLDTATSHIANVLSTIVIKNSKFTVSSIKHQRVMKLANFASSWTLILMLFFQWLVNQTLLGSKKLHISDSASAYKKLLKFF